MHLEAYILASALYWQMDNDELCINALSRDANIKSICRESKHFSEMFTGGGLLFLFVR